MEIDFQVTLDYGEDGPDENEATPGADEIGEWVIRGMAADGFSSAEVSTSGQ